MSNRRPIEYGTWSGNSRHGQIEHLVDGEAGVGYETPSRARALVEADGEQLGAVRLPLEVVLRDDAPTCRYVNGSIQVRQSLVREQAQLDSLSAHRLIISEEARRKLSEETVSLLGDDLVLQVGEEEAARGRFERAKAKVQTLKDDFASSLSALERGLIGKRGLLLIEGSVALYDAAIIHPFLETAGFGSFAAWASTITIPALIGSVHMAFGTLAGFVAGEIKPRNRLRLVTGTLVAGIAVLMVGLITLGVFRGQGLEHLNQQLAEVASGGSTDKLALFTNPGWMMWLQLCGSVAAVSAAALYALGQPGRILKDKLAGAEVEEAEAKRELDVAAGDVRTTRQQIKQAKLAMPQTAVDAREAAAELVVKGRATEARVAAEAGLGEALRGRYGVSLRYHHQAYGNGEVKRAAVPDGGPNRYRRPKRHGPRDIGSRLDPEISSSKSSRRRFGFRRWFS